MSENGLLDEDDVTKLNILKKDFTLNDFLEDDYCRNILNDNFNKKVSVLDDKIIKLYKKFVEYNRDEIFLNKDKNGNQCFRLLNIIYKYIITDYDITVFYKDVKLVNHLLAKYEEKNYELNNN